MLQNDYRVLSKYHYEPLVMNSIFFQFLDEILYPDYYFEEMVYLYTVASMQYMW